MRPSRRELLAALSAAACAPAAGPRRHGRPGHDVPSPWRPAGRGSEADFPGGVRATDPSGDRLLLTARTRLPEGVLVGAAWDGRAWVALPPRAGLSADDGALRVDLQGLRPDTPHAFAFTSPDGALRSDVGTWRTLPRRPQTVRIGATSCLGSSNPGFPTLDVAAGLGLDLVLFVGDAIFTRARTAEAYRAEYDTLLATPSFRALASSSPIAVVWDDHEVANNWTTGRPTSDRQTPVTPAQVAAAAAAMRGALPWREGPGGTGLWRSLRLGDAVEIVVLDCRGERDGASMMSEAQLRWAEDTLRPSPCPFRLVVSSVHLTDHGAVLSPEGSDDDVRDRWQGFPAQRERLVAAASAVPGVAIVTGDMHFGAIQRVGRPGEPGEGLVEVGAGPAGSQPFDVVRLLAERGVDDPRYLALVPTWSLAVFEADMEAGTLGVELLGDDGEVLAADGVA